MTRVIIACFVAYCVFEIARTAVFCYRSDRYRKELKRIPTHAEDLTEAYNHHARVIELSEKHREMETAWWMWPHRPDA